MMTVSFSYGVVTRTDDACAVIQPSCSPMERGEDALLRGRPRVEVVGVDLVERLGAVVDDDLAAGEVRVPERRGGVHDRARRELAELLERDEALEVDERGREERAVGGDDRERGRAVGEAAGLEGNHDEVLLREPVERLLLGRREVVPVDVAEARLVGRAVVRDAHAVRVAAPHVVLGVVHGDAVGAADDVRLLDETVPGDLEHDVERVRVRVGSHGHREQLGARRRHSDVRARPQGCLHRGRQGHLVQKVLHYVLLGRAERGLGGVRARLSGSSPDHGADSPLTKTLLRATSHSLGLRARTGIPVDGHQDLTTGRDSLGDISTSR